MVIFIGEILPAALYVLGSKEGLPPSRGDCLEILGAPKSWSPKGLQRDCFYFILKHSVKM
jgi:hypothetical protein